ncbi:MAG: hypothetical protein HYZ85_04025 [Candidatus Omnitrophica bacterium]|nr:hypothetical protein [Candidatus Omnitrophota bacterium]
MAREYLRTFKVYDLDEVKEHLVIAGDLSGDCAKCRELGIDYLKAASCPQCGTPFKYIASRRLDSHPGERFQFARRIQEKRPDLIMIDHTDYTSAVGHKKARDFFG